MELELINKSLPYLSQNKKPKKKNHFRDRSLHRNNEYTKQMSKFIAGNKVQDHRDITQKQSFTCFTYLDTIERNESVLKIYWVSQKLLRYSKRVFSILKEP